MYIQFLYVVVFVVRVYMNIYICFVLLSAFFMYVYICDPMHMYMYMHGSFSFVGLEARKKGRALVYHSAWVHLPRDAEQRCQKESASRLNRARIKRNENGEGAEDKRNAV